MNGTSDSEGRVEVFYGRAWGSVCDDGWDANDAAVVCNFLGFTGSSEALNTAWFGQGPGDQGILLSNVNCAGSEGSLEQCAHDGAAGSPVQDCTHAEDAGVKCGLPDASGTCQHQLCILMDTRLIYSGQDTQCA